MKEITLEEKKERVKNFRPIDDVFFEVIAEDKEVSEEILRTILEDDALVVDDVVTQKSERNIYGRSVRLDALCTLGNNTKCNIEVQRSNNDNHIKRVRFNASSITFKDSHPQETFDGIVELYVIYISEFDIFKEGKTIYHIEKVIHETGTVIDDGLHEIFVNTAIDDGSAIADLMNCFTKKEVNNSRFPKLSSRVKELKTTEGGVTVMCDIMEKYLAESKAEGIKQGIKQGIEQGIERGKLEQIIEFVKEGLISISDASRKANMSEEDFKLLLK